MPLFRARGKGAPRGRFRVAGQQGLEIRQ